ncbi:hypothetical protein RIF29_40601 [Crotalaria pallida]|uniref:Uncharacterized protein n=1 Tax=Crotalaria pallida TaxID=3830 RepID=A0AAN9E9Q6_CROPI
MSSSLPSSFAFLSLSLSLSSIGFLSLVRHSRLVPLSRFHSVPPSVVRRSHSVPLYLRPISVPPLVVHFSHSFLSVSVPFGSSVGGSSLFGVSSVRLGASFLSLSPLVHRWFLSTCRCFSLGGSRFMFKGGSMVYVEPKVHILVEHVYKRLKRCHSDLERDEASYFILDASSFKNTQQKDGKNGCWREPWTDDDFWMMVVAVLEEKEVEGGT